MIARLINLFRNRHMKRGLAQLQEGSGVLLLTPAMQVRPGWRVLEQEARSWLAKSAYARAEAKRLSNHRLELEVSGYFPRERAEA